MNSDTPKPVLIQGDTYPVKDRLKDLGGVWDPQLKGWWIPAENVAEAKNLVDNCEGQLDFDALE